MHDLINYIHEREEVLQYLSDLKDIQNLPRAYLVNVINSILEMNSDSESTKLSLKEIIKLAFRTKFL
jgi:hypothetical protein